MYEKCNKLEKIKATSEEEILTLVRIACDYQQNGINICLMKKTY